MNSETSIIRWMNLRVDDIDASWTTLKTERGPTGEKLGEKVKNHLGDTHMTTYNGRDSCKPW
jgi:hypothetical protein